MMYSLRILTILTVFACLLPGASTPIQAAIRHAEQNITIEASETIDDDLFITSNSIEIAGTINGDVYAAGSRVLVTGTINGDLLAAGGSVIIKGTVRDDVRVAGGRVDISGSTIGDNLTMLGGMLTMEGSTVTGSTTIAGGMIDLAGTMKRHLLIAGGDILLKGIVEKDTLALSETLTLASSARIGGDLRYTSQNEATLTSDQVSGKITHTRSHDKKPTAQGSPVGSVFALGIAAWVTAAFFLLLFPKSALVPSAFIITRPVRSLFVGLSVLIGLFPLSLFFMITGVGAPLGILTLMVLLSLMYGAHLITAGALGIFLVRNSGLTFTSPLAACMVGIAALYIMWLIPVIGGSAFILSTVLGCGAAAQALYARVLSER